MSKLPFKEFFKNKTNNIQGYIPGHLNSEVHEVGMNGRGNWQSWISLSLRPHSERRKWKKKKNLLCEKWLNIEGCERGIKIKVER